MLSLTEKELKLHQDSTVCCTCKNKLTRKLAKYKKQRKCRDHCHFTGKYKGAAHSICSLKFNVSTKIPVDFHNGSNYNYHFIMK